MHVVVIVLGDVGRSPRMQYHTASLLKQGHMVSLVGYKGTDLIPELAGEKNPDHQLNVVRFTVPSPASLKKVLPIYLMWRILSLCLCVVYALWFLVPRASSVYKRQHVGCVLVQNPPAMPLLAVVYCFGVWQRLIGRPRPAMIIDWHNLGFTMLSNPIFRKVAELYERVMGPLATSHLCVTKAMKEYLANSFRIPRNKIHVLYDCPPDMFQPLSTTEQHKILTKLNTSLCNVCPRAWYQHLDSGTQTLFTEQFSNEALPRPSRPAFLISSTSWTPDEDFGQLLDALVVLDETITQKKSLLKVMVVVTGKGPQRGHYQERMSKLKLSHIAIQTLWLEPGDYPKLLACADLGVSLHTSTSGIDLPMKVLDLFGCQVPVVARDFSCLSELVQDDENGRVFDTSRELSEHLWYLLKPLGDAENIHMRYLPHSYGELDRYSSNLEDRTRWDKNWTVHALPAFATSQESA